MSSRTTLVGGLRICRSWRSTFTILTCGTCCHHRAHTIATPRCTIADRTIFTPRRTVASEVVVAHVCKRVADGKKSVSHVGHVAWVRYAIIVCPCFRACQRGRGQRARDTHTHIQRERERERERRTCIHTCTRARVRTRTHARTHAHTHTRTYTHAHTHARTHTRKHTQARTYAHTHRR